MIPKLRFPEFTDEWQILQFNSIFERVTRKNKENNKNILTISAQEGLVRQDKFFSKFVAAKDVTGYYLLYRNDYAYNKSYSKGYPMGAIKRLTDDEKGVVSTLYICFRALDDRALHFFDQYFAAGRLNTEIEKIAQEGARNHGLLNMAVGDFFGMRLIIPGIDERKKIADFLTTIDGKIAKLDKRIELLKQYKKGVIQKIFTQQISFKDERGNDYPSWEEKKLSEILYERKTYLPKGRDLEHISLTTEGVVPKSARYERDFLVSKRKEKSYKITYLNDICYNPANLKFGVIARNKYGDGIFSPIYVTFVVTDNDINFVEHLLTRKDFIQRARKYEEGTVYERMAVKPSDFLTLIVDMPCIDEQQKIADFLGAMDDKIKVEETKLANAKKFKNALLKRMFV